MKKKLIHSLLMMVLVPTISFAKLAEDKALQKLTQNQPIESLSAKNTDYTVPLSFPPPINVAAWATAKGNNITMGDLLIDIREDDTTYRIEAHLLTRGLIKKFTKFRSKTVTTGIKKDGRYIPKTFFSKRHLRDKIKTSSVEYDDKGKIIKSVVNPPDKRWKRALVKDEIRDYTIDPLTMILVARQHTYNAHKNGDKSFTLPLYDARRRSNLLFDLKNMEKVKYKRKKVDAHHLVYQREIISGFTEKELKRIEDEEPVVDFYVSEKFKFLPVKAHGAAPLGKADAYVKKFCATLDECFKKYKD